MCFAQRHSLEEDSMEEIKFPISSSQFLKYHARGGFFKGAWWSQCKRVFSGAVLQGPFSIPFLSAGRRKGDSALLPVSTVPTRSAAPLQPTAYKLQSSAGTVLVLVVVLIFVVSLVILAILSNATMQLRLVRQTQDKELAFHIAEAGVNYYQWYLAHFPKDYSDGTGQVACSPCGPYVHDFTDFDTGQVVGRYSLTITPPSVGTTVVTITSNGYTMANPQVVRTITVRYGIPSLAQYAFLTNSDVWIGSSESVSGQMTANGGIRFDGTANAPIRSAKTTYTCPSWSGSPCPTTRPGVWGTASAASQSYWQYPVPNVDFSSMTSDLATMKTSAQGGGLYLPPSNALGYSLVFNADGTVTVYKVTSLRSMSGITAYDVTWTSVSPTVDYQNRALQFTQAIPVNGLIFVEDHVWVEGTVQGRAQVTAAKLPYNATTAPNIYIPNNIVYAAKDGSDVLGLIAQKHVVATYYTPDNLEIDAAIIAQNGSVQRYYFSGGSYNIRNNITVYGSLGTFGQWTWSYVSGSTVTSGFVNTHTTYDANLLYGPPPSFPLTTDGYQQMSWESDQ